MKPIVVAAAEAANKVVQNGQFEDEAKSLTGVSESFSYPLPSAPASYPLAGTCLLPTRGH